MRLVTSNPDVLWGTPVFAGTRVPAKTLTDYLSVGDSLDDFLADFPEVTRAQAEAFLRQSADSLIAAEIRLI